MSEITYVLKFHDYIKKEFELKTQTPEPWREGNWILFMRIRV